MLKALGRPKLDHKEPGYIELVGNNSQRGHFEDEIGIWKVK